MNEALGQWLLNRKLNIGYGLFSPPGLAFSGTPGQSVRDILREQALADAVAVHIAAQGEFASSLARVADVRARLAGQPALAWALQPKPRIAARAREAPGLLRQAGAVLPAFVGVFLWPLLLVILPLAAWLAWPTRHGTSAAILSILLFLVLVFAATALALVGSYIAFRRGEDADWISDAAPTLDQSKAMFARENAHGYAHNHMMSHTVRKPGMIRAVTLRLAFMVIAKLTALNPRPGFLGDIGTIHFARWITLPGTRDLIFFSNFGGSWESYLEDFITRAHAGLTGVWSNSIGFPRTRNLFQDGATDGERFKRFARQSMTYTPFWFSAYPTLTTSNIRTNALIRRGLHSETEVEAVEWLSLFGSSPRPAGKLDTPQIQSIVFGGLGFKPEGRLLTVRLGEDQAANRTWLRELMPDIAFNDGRYIKDDAVVTLALTPSGLSRLGLPDQALESFPVAFRLGMRGEGRAHILGDDPHASQWWWDAEPVEAALLVYGDDCSAVERQVSAIREALKACGSIVNQIDLTTVGEKLVDRKEPFGFVDGVSQPAIRGTYRGLRNADPIHLVEPGEILLGYPDNRGTIPPGPSMDARYDPTMMLPITSSDAGFTETIKSNPRSIGLNGSFLVIRQLEQDQKGFWDYCEKQAHAFAKFFPEPAICDAEFIAAKMIGRWTDGSSLVRNPYMSATKLKVLYGTSEGGATMREKARPADASATPVETGDRAAPPATRAPKPDNDFLFGTEDPQGLRCPYGAHVRRANPRDSLSPGSMEQVEINNRHRILRIGRGFAAEGDRQAGLMFMCLNADIERQFEFIQQTWMGSVKFHGLDKEADPIAVTGEAGRNGFTIPVRTGPVSLEPLPRFVTLRGGGYFFVPGRQLLRYLAHEALP
ncbi:deferrochelatase/peroxidase EfeB [Novosphingobium chloroacetimidivorans]|uniref:Deferrochelatase/peroxidase EfeB n=1 Tax=Novosphingobium chloroacetimidivorans TaxID=1428314 RepID=A0A7W7NXR2_9SPHN|nr:Dyp-type peroxidase [Novosphingobium chloroacetimidivorans]MBB4860616.1 deferrochelatase/peroxidase EfeB [Novosphingobium chloroacetimidivorans]